MVYTVQILKQTQWEQRFKSYKLNITNTHVYGHKPAQYPATKYRDWPGSQEESSG